MAEFSDVRRDWGRMCHSFGDSCKGCPLNIFENACGAIYDTNRSINWNAVSMAIKNWAEEHPEPDTPTWFDYLCSIGVLHDCKSAPEVLIKVSETHITPAIAESLGILPE